MTSATLPPSDGGRVEDAGGEQDGGEPGDERELREPEQPDPDHLAGEQVARPHRRQDQLDDAVVLLLDDAAEDPLPVDRERHRAGAAAPSIRDENLGVGASPAGGSSVAVVSSGAGGRWLRSARTAVSATAASLRVDVCAEDEPVLAEEQERVDLLRLERRASGGRRGDDPQPHLRVVEGLRRPLRARRRGPRGAGAVTATRYVGFVRERPWQRARPADEHEHDQRRDEEGAAAQPLADLAPGDERDRAPAAHRATSSRKSSASDGGP